MSSSTRSLIASATLTLLVAAAPVAHAQTPAPAHVLRHVPEARATGSGRLTWLGLTVYDARLYAIGPIDAAAFQRHPFALELTYARALSGKAIADRSHTEIARLGSGSAEQRSGWLTAMQAMFPNVQPGQSIVGIHLPGRATRFYLDGRALGSIDDPDFGPAFFSIWLDPRTSAPQLREQLLALRARP
jgi:hypothetical protein